MTTTVTMGSAGAASTITSAVNILPTDASLRYGGCVVGPWAATPTYYTTAQIAPQSRIFFIEFMFDGTSFEFSVKGTGSGFYRLKIDGTYLTTLGQAGPSASGQDHKALVAFGSRAIRRVQIEGRGDFRFGGLYIGPNDTVWQSPSRGVRAVVLGDSYSGGTGADDAFTGYWWTLCRLLGWRDPFTSETGGSGYIAVGTNGNGGTSYKMRDRIANDVTPLAADVIVVAGGLNDGNAGTATATIEAEANLLFAALRAGTPGARLFAIGPWSPTGSPSTGVTNARTAVVNACATSAVTFIDAFSIFTGTGKVGTTTGSGNCDLYRSSDGTHPVQAGHDFLAHELNARIRAA